MNDNTINERKQLAAKGFIPNHAHTHAICRHCGKIYRVGQRLFTRHAATHSTIAPDKGKRS